VNLERNGRTNIENKKFQAKERKGGRSQGKYVYVEGKKRRLLSKEIEKGKSPAGKNPTPL